MYLKIWKRFVDLAIALVAIVLASPLLIFFTLVLLIINDGKPFFFQERPGWKERRFRVIKFKTMTDKKDDTGNLLPNHLRITKVGSFMRSLSLDELPQLFNVLRGDMSLVGPRPLLFKYIPLYNSEQRRRHDVRPGITGWAQVNGRNSISWTEKFRLDIYYIDNVSFTFDIKILWLTFLKVIKREGVNAAEQVTMPPFNGQN